jgi:hypothetical protein
VYPLPLDDEAATDDFLVRQAAMVVV